MSDRQPRTEVDERKNAQSLHGDAGQSDKSDRSVRHAVSFCALKQPDDFFNAPEMTGDPRFHRCWLYPPFYSLWLPFRELIQPSPDASVRLADLICR
jgi:hypothetical protein